MFIKRIFKFIKVSTVNMIENVILIDRGNNDAELARMKREELLTHRERNIIIFNEKKYRVLEAERVPATEEAYNDTYFTYVYVELAPERHAPI